MSYCRFSSGDVYLYPSIYGGIECCACRLADLVPTIFTKGLPEDSPRLKLFNMVPNTPCEHCNGDGCKKCMMFGSTTFFSRSDAIKHLEEHRKVGHKVPEHAFEYLREEMEEIGDTTGLEVPDEKPSPVLDLKTGKRIPLEDL